MNNRDWEKEDWEILIRTISRGNCILMLGPDASFEEVNGKPQPLSEILSRELAESDRIKSIIEERKVDPANLARVAHYYSREAARVGLETRVEDFYDKRKSLTSDFHRDLAALPFYLTISSSPDRMFYNALKEAGKKPVIEGYNFKGEKDEVMAIAMGTVETPLLFNLYGRVKEPQSLVLTENDLIEFLVNVASGLPPLPPKILSELKGSQKSFLFLGFGLKHWYLRVLLHVFEGDKKQAYSVALEQLPPLANEEEFQKTILYFEDRDCKIRIYNKEFKTFVKELREKYQKDVSKRDKYESSTKIPVEAPPIESKPMVFICHASENKDFAVFIYEMLERAGFNTWLDKVSLRGGDNWNEVITKAIEEEIDYVVVLQSADLAKKIKGYVNKEINMALEQQREFQKGIRFIIPTKIDDCDLREELEHLHTIDLSGKQNVDELVKTIRRDYYQKRKGGQR